MTEVFQEWRQRFLSLLAGAPTRGTERWLLILILVITAAIRASTVHAPSLDRTHWKEVDYLQVSQNYWRHGYRFHQPEIDWPAEPPRVTAMEFPLVPFATALGYPFLGVTPFSVRWVGLVAWLLVVAYTYRLARREMGALVGLLASSLAAIIPLYHTFGNLLFSEPLMIAMSVAGLFYYAEWLDNSRRRDWCLAVAGISLAIALKAEPLYLLLPLGVLTYRRHGPQPSAFKTFVTFVAAALVLPVSWYAYALYLRQTSLDVFGVFGGHDKLQTFAMLADPTWYRLMASRVGGGILGGEVGTLLALIGTVSLLGVRAGWVYLSYLGAILAYFGLVAEGNLDAPYRQLHGVPVFATLVAAGAAAVAALVPARFVPLDRWRPWLFALLLVALVPLKRASVIFGRDPAEPANALVWEAGQQLRRLAVPGDKLVAFGEYTVHKGGNDLSPLVYHYSGLRGWTLQSWQWDLDTVAALARKGARFFVARQWSREPGSAGFLAQMRAQYPTLYRHPVWEILILDLRRPAPVVP